MTYSSFYHSSKLFNQYFTKDQVLFLRKHCVCAQTSFAEENIFIIYSICVVQWVLAYINIMHFFCLFAVFICSLVKLWKLWFSFKGGQFADLNVVIKKVFTERVKLLVMGVVAITYLLWNILLLWSRVCEYMTYLFSIYLYCYKSNIDNFGRGRAVYMVTFKRKL